MVKENINVLFITQSLGFGGASKILTFVAQSLEERGHKIFIANLKGTKEAISYEREVSERIIVKDFSKLSRKNQILNIKNFAKEKKIEIIIGFTEIPNAISRIVSLMLGIPSIMSERGDPVHVRLGRTIKDKIVLSIINSSKGGVFQTEGAREFYGKGLRKRGAIIPNPVFVNGELPEVNINEREKSVVSVARLDNFSKRYDVMLDAFKLFSDKHPDYILKLYGKGNDEELIKQWVEDRDLSDKVRFMGLTTSPMKDIAKDGMFIISSDSEGISNSLLEAMAVGLPCVSTDHTPGGARLLITHGENGLLSPIGDAEKLAENMCNFAEDKELAKKCGKNAKDVLVRFAPNKIIDMWESYIIKLVEMKK